MIYFDNAATTYPKPKSVIIECNQGMLRGVNAGRSGYELAIKASESVFNCRQKAADFFNLDNVEKCILTPSCTVSLNTVIQGVLNKGDNVVISSLEHNAVLRPIKRLVDKGIITYTVAEIFESDDDRTVDSFRKCINDKTKLVICTHASNVFGIKLPINRIAALCRYYNVLFCVDAAQTAGIVPIDINEINADYVCCPGHKGLYGPMGTGLLLINNNLLPQSLYQGGTGSSNLDLSEPDIIPDKYESGTMNLPGFWGLSAGIDFVNSKGISKIHNHEMSIIKYIYNGLKGIKGVKLYTSEPNSNHYVPLLSFNLDGIECNTLAQKLDKGFSICVRSGYHCSPLAHKYMETGETGTVRVCPSVFNSKIDADKLINAIFIISKNKK